MSTCCASSRDPAQTRSGELTIALAGNPNCGKTTIFNALTGLRQKVANYPGVTVEKKTGRLKLPDGNWATVIDLPGTYSLISRSPDEMVTMEVLRGLRPRTPAPDVVIVVVDASNLQRNLYLVSQLIELGRPLLVALNMMDVAERRGIHVSPQSLGEALGVTVVAMVGHKRQGIEDLKQAIASARTAPMPDWPLPAPMRREVEILGGRLASMDAEGRSATGGAATGLYGAPAHPSYEALAERLLIGDRAGDIAPLAGQVPIAEQVRSATARLAEAGIEPMQADIEAHYRWIEKLAERASANVEELAAMGTTAPREVLGYETARGRTLSDSIDAVFMHKIWGLVVFSAIMATIFVSIFSLAAPIMDAVQAAVTWIGIKLSAGMSDGPLKSLINDGIFNGVGAVVVFVPQIALLFFFLAVLEDSGYLARAAFLMDRLLAKVGLHGKAFIPLLSSFACAIPGIMATRTIENRRDRLATILIAPFMSCSARLPVYLLLIGTLFAGAGAMAQAGIMLACYALGILAAVVTAIVFKRTFLKGAPSAFILEMPSYKVPQASQVLRHVLSNTWEFLAKAGTIIFCLSVVLWALMYYPRLPESRIEQVALEARANMPAVLRDGVMNQSNSAAASEDIDASRQAWIDEAVRGEELRHSFAGRFGRTLEPVIRPLGFDWKMGVGLVGAFAAREVFVSTMGIVYSVGGNDEDTSSLTEAMRADVYPRGDPRAGQDVWTPLVGISMLVWFVLAMQCMSTLAVVRRETAGWKWPLFMLVYMNGLAYVICLGVYQIGLLATR